MSKNREEISLKLQAVKMTTDNVKNVRIAGVDKVRDIDWQEMKKAINNIIMEKNFTESKGKTKSDITKIVATVSSAKFNKEKEFVR